MASSISCGQLQVSRMHCAPHGMHPSVLPSRLGGQEKTVSFETLKSTWWRPCSSTNTLSGGELLAKRNSLGVKKLQKTGNTSTWKLGAARTSCSLRDEGSTPAPPSQGTSWSGQGSFLAGLLGLSASLVVAFAPGHSLAASPAAPTGPFPCEDVASFYKAAQGLSGPALKAHLHQLVAGHQPVSYAEVWNALKILDAIDDANPEGSPDVREIYTRLAVSKELAAKAEGWNREHLWPRSYGLVQGLPQFTDLHNLRPADVNVNSSRGNKYFGECSPQGDTPCLVPANREAAPDTAADRLIWMPPTEVRGDIARALFYMAVRYEGEEPGSLDLELSDRPSIAEGRMGLLSVLLRWHALDPPAGSEQLRNARVCSLYQHNRNPFVDHPEYVNLIWGPAPAGSLAVAGAILGPGPAAWINEFHYKNVGPDQGEFVEVVVGPGVDPQTLTVYLYNGKDGKAYTKIPLSSFASGQVLENGYKVFAKYVSTGIQNGPSDGMALVQEGKDPASSQTVAEVLQFLSYEGILTAVDGPAKGKTSTDVGVQEESDSPVTGSVELVGKGRTLGAFSWTVTKEGSTFGAVNKAQEIR